MESAFEFSSLRHFHLAFDFTTADRNIQRASLPLLFLSGKGTAKLRGESWLDPPVFRRRFGGSLLCSFGLEERTEFLQRRTPCPDVMIRDGRQVFFEPRQETQPASRLGFTEKCLTSWLTKACGRGGFADSTVRHDQSKRDALFHTTRSSPASNPPRLP